MDEDLTANEILERMLEDFGLNTPELLNQLVKNLEDNASEISILQGIRKTDTYKKRFAGMERRKELGAAPINEFQYMELEQSYRRAMQAAGLPSGFYDEPEDFAEFIGQDRSAQEIQSVVAVAEEAANTADPETLRALQDFYGVAQGDVVAYYLDPQRATSVIEERRRLRAAGIAAAGETTLGQRFDIGTAEALEREQVQRREIQQRLAGREGLMSQTIGEARMGAEEITSSELAAAEFGLDRETVGRISQVRQQRAAAGAARSGAIVTGEGIATYQ